MLLLVNVFGRVQTFSFQMVVGQRFQEVAVSIFCDETMFRCLLRSCRFRIAPRARAVASSPGGSPKLAPELRNTTAMEMIATPPDYMSAVVSVPPATQTDPSAVIKARDDFHSLMMMEMKAQGAKIEALMSRKCVLEIIVKHAFVQRFPPPRTRAGSRVAALRLRAHHEEHGASSEIL
jgi:hypothetical protein